MADQQLPDIQMDTTDLYREETFTDNRVGTLRRMTPVTPEGEVDANRKTLYIGSASLMTPAGALPISFELEAESLSAALDQFGDAAQKALVETIEELKEMRRNAASSIVVPQGGAGGPGGMPGGGFGGGMPGGGKIKLP